jgi:hypothetical protein
MKNLNSARSIDLLNSEGPILKLIKSNNGFTVIDEWKVKIATLTRDEIIQFIEGNLAIIDSHDQYWEYPNISTGMKLNIPDILEFIGDSYLIDTDSLYSKYTEWVHKVSESNDWKTTFGPREIVEAIVKILEDHPKLISRK